MALKILKTLNFSKRITVLRSALNVLKKEMRSSDFLHLSRLLKDGTERDLIFIKGLGMGVELTALTKEDIKELMKILQKGIAREKIGSKDGLFQKSELKKIDEILQPEFPFKSRKKLIAILSRADGMLLDGLIEVLQKT